MDAVEFIKEHGRMCRTYYGCDGCLARNNDGSCKFSTIVGDGADEQIALLEEWAAAHPRKTRQSVFLEQWPEAEISFTDGFLTLDPCKFYKKMRKECVGKLCSDCRHEFWAKEVE